jgi:hypothetical protein
MGLGLLQSADSLRDRDKSGVLLEVVIIKQSVNLDYIDAAIWPGHSGDVRDRDDDVKCLQSKF